jgi:hypothetical protein
MIEVALQRVALVELKALAERSAQPAAVDLLDDVAADAVDAGLRRVEQDRAQLHGQDHGDDGDHAYQQQCVEGCDPPAQTVEAADLRGRRANP